MSYHSVMEYSSYVVLGLILVVIVYPVIRGNTGKSLNRLLSFFARSQGDQNMKNIYLSGTGGFVAISLIGLLGDVTGSLLLMAPFGATCVLLFSAPLSPLSQPVNVIGGHLVSTLVGMLLHSVFPAEWWAMGLAVGLAISIMAALRITHPPAGADPLVVFLTSPSWEYILVPVLTGSTMLVLIAWLFYKLPSQEKYPAGLLKNKRS